MVAHACNEPPLVWLRKTGYRLQLEVNKVKNLSPNTSVEAPALFSCRVLNRFLLRPPKYHELISSLVVAQTHRVVLGILILLRWNCVSSLRVISYD